MILSCPYGENQCSNISSAFLKGKITLLRGDPGNCYWGYRIRRLPTPNPEPSLNSTSPYVPQTRINFSFCIPQTLHTFLLIRTVIFLVLYLFSLHLSSQLVCGLMHVCSRGDKGGEAIIFFLIFLIFILLWLVNSIYSINVIGLIMKY